MGREDVARTARRETEGEAERAERAEAVGKSAVAIPAPGSNVTTPQLSQAPGGAPTQQGPNLTTLTAVARSEIAASAPPHKLTPFATAKVMAHGISEPAQSSGGFSSSSSPP